jgi:hypothetical protein
MLTGKIRTTIAAAVALSGSAAASGSRRSRGLARRATKSTAVGRTRARRLDRASESSVSAPERPEWEKYLHATSRAPP